MTKQSCEEDAERISRGVEGLERTPSPESIPLPPSAGPEQAHFQVHRSPAKIFDQYGWSPFDDTMFAQRASDWSGSSCEKLNNLVVRVGGWVAVWRQLGLACETGPRLDSRSLTYEEVVDLWDEIRIRTGAEFVDSNAEDSTLWGSDD